MGGETGRLARHAGSMAVSLYVSRFAVMGRGFVAARVLGPAGFGLWNAFQLIWEYGQYIHLGVLNGLNKEISYRMGRGEREEVERLKDTGLGSMLLTSMGSWVILLGVLWFRRGELSTLVIAGAAVAGGVVVIEEVILAYVSVLRAFGRITLISRTEILYALVNLAASLVMVVRFGLPGLLGAWIVTRGGALIYLATTSGLRFRPRWERGRSLQLLRRGGWVFLYLVTAALLRTADRAVVLGGLGVQDLGYYALAATCAGLVAYVPAAVAFVIYPVFLEKYGESGDVRSLAGHLHRSLGALALLIPLMVAVVLLLIPIPLFHLLPGYVEAIPAIRILLAGSFFAGLAPVPVFFLLAVDRDPILVVLSAAGAGLSIVLAAVAVRGGWGIQGVAGAKAVADCMYGSCVVWYAGSLAKKSGRAGAGLLLRSLLPGFWMVLGLAVGGLVAGWPAWEPLGPETGSSLERLGIFLALSAPLFWFYGRRWGMRSLWQEISRGNTAGRASAGRSDEATSWREPEQGPRSRS